MRRLRAEEQRTAYFYRISNGQRVSGQTLLATRESVTIGVSRRDNLGRGVSVVTEAPGVICEKKPLAAPASSYNQEWTIRTKISAEAHLEIRSHDGKILDQLTIVFAGNFLPVSVNAFVNVQDKAEVFAAVRSGRILDSASQLRAVETQGFYSPDGRRKVLLADAMFPVLASLARGGVVNILSLMRFGQTPHGRIVAENTAVCSAVDIGGFGGFPIDLTTPQGARTDPGKVASTISGVAGVINHLADGVYAFGFTRPTPHDNGPAEPENDVFLPKQSGESDYKTWIGNASAQFVNPRAVAEVGDALTRRSKICVDRMFQDGRDHLHLEVISSAPGCSSSHTGR